MKCIEPHNNTHHLKYASFSTWISNTCVFRLQYHPDVESIILPVMWRLKSSTSSTCYLAFVWFSRLISASAFDHAEQEIGWLETTLYKCRWWPHIDPMNTRTNPQITAMITSKCISVYTELWYIQVEDNMIQIMLNEHARKELLPKFDKKIMRYISYSWDSIGDSECQFLFQQVHPILTEGQLTHNCTHLPILMPCPTATHSIAIIMVLEVPLCCHIMHQLCIYREHCCCYNGLLFQPICATGFIMLCT